MWWDGGYAQLEAWGGCGWPLAFYTDVESPELPDSVFFFGKMRELGQMILKAFLGF